MNDVDLSVVMLRDLCQHFDQRLSVLMTDLMERCDQAGICYDHATSMAFTILSHSAASAAHGLDCGEEEFVTACRFQFKEVGRIRDEAER